MLRANSLFENSFDRVNNIHELYKHLVHDLHFSEEFLSDLLRSEIVYIISAFDKFIHDLVRAGILETFNSQRSETASYKKFPLNLSQVDAITNPSLGVDPNQVLNNIIIENHKHLSFQDPDKVSDALSLIWNENHKWQKIADQMSMSQNSVKVQFKNIVIRRNQIVHEGDFDTFTNQILDIDEHDVKHSVNFVKELAETIYNLIKI